MSDEPVMTPITPEESGDMPPKVAPFNAAAPAGAAAPAAAPSSGVSTIKLKPVIRKPMIRKPTIGGTPKPAADDGWTCECGTHNTGKFCENCGKPRA